ncbi:MAG: ABC transporter C-terminal domain-containing protein, partial [Candidatus Dormiibacterota bacterium]
DERISQLEGERAELSRRLTDPETYRSAGGESALVERLRQVEGELETSYAAWIDLEGRTER